MEKIVDRTLDKILSLFFSKDKTKLLVLFFFIIGFILRIVAIINLPTTVDASGHALMAFNFVSSGKLATWNQSVGLWHYLTDLAYKLFGVGDFGARFIALIFGSLSIIVIFLFTKEIFDKRAGLIASFLLAVSPFHVVETLPEMDVAMMFFVLLSMLFFVKALKQEKKLLFILSGLILGTGILIKVYSLLFIPALVLYSIYYAIKYKTNKKTFVKNILIFFFTVFIFCFVPLAYNYLLYQDKGFVDYIFTNTLGIGKEKSDIYYSWISPYKHDYINFFFPGKQSKLPFFVYYVKSIFNSDMIIIGLGLIGLLLSFRLKNKDYLVLNIIMFFTVYLYMGSLVYLMNKHYLFLLIFFAPFAGLSLSKISEKVRIKSLLAILLLLILVFQLFWISVYTGGSFYERSSMNKLVSYKLNNIPQNSLVILDSRIFRGIGTYIFLDKHYLESNYFAQLANSQEQLSGITQPIETYFIECATDDCGWGTVADQPEFNKSMEEIVDFFEQNAEVVKKIPASNKKIPLSYSYTIYKTTLNLKPASLDLADSTHTFWGNPVGYNEKIGEIFDNYETDNSLDRLIDKIAHWIFHFAVLISLVSILYILYLFVMEKEDEN